MQTLLIFLIIFLNISQYQCESSLCRTNCSNNGTIDNECWRTALVYRSSELIERLFSFSSLSVYVDAYQRHHHSRELNDSIKLIDKSLENHLLNESIDANLTINLFTETKQILINFCRNLISTPVESIDKLPSLSCSTSTCSSDILNYMVLFIVTTIMASLILIICIVQFFQTRRVSSSLASVQRPGPFINSLSTNNTTVNA